MSLTRTSINNPYGVIALALAVLALGLFAFFRTPTDLFPDTAPPQVSVITVNPGASSLGVTVNPNVWAASVDVPSVNVSVILAVFAGSDPSCSKVTNESATSCWVNVVATTPFTAIDPDCALDTL